MATKTTGAELKAFYNDAKFWPEGTWHEDESIFVDNVSADCFTDLSKVADDAAIILADGFVTDEAGRDLGSFEGYFRKWRKLRATVSLVVETPRNNVENLRACIIAGGGKIV